ncbi:hypothetical protein HYPSUDRAFT_894385 [Hypholoma sublateritium FD-334 SS-4]|uniref:Uncharacterized protein n=1 Tax=Hypholoma sublateritium (strain FD-334 SS-4) TaxID=945553 RepID=A0A0D2PGP7_HYPSF|nr:hypothetical protein HYPSUDRAFT_894385 [Hypholoma sublateritium FD-334 SS-4]
MYTLPLARPALCSYRVYSLRHSPDVRPRLLQSVASVYVLLLTALAFEITLWPLNKTPSTRSRSEFHDGHRVRLLVHARCAACAIFDTARCARRDRESDLNLTILAASLLPRAAWLPILDHIRWPWAAPLLSLSCASLHAMFWMRQLSQ